MATIITRETGATAKGSPLTNAELDANFVNLNTSKLEASNIVPVHGVDISTDVAGNVLIDVKNFGGNCKNTTSVTIPKGTPVYQTGVVGVDTPTVAPADAADPNKMPAIGVAGEDLAADAEGDIVYLGNIKGVDTSAFGVGDEVYVAGGGGYTNIRPANGSGLLIQFLGVVNRVHPSNGSGIIFGTATAQTQSLETTDSVEFAQVTAGNLTLDNNTVAAIGNLVLAPTGYTDAGAKRITNLAEPVAGSDAATKQYVDSAAGNISTNITLAHGLFYSKTTTVSGNLGESFVVDSFELAEYRSGKYQLQIQNGNGYYTCELLVIHNNGSVNTVQYADLLMGNPVADISAVINGNSVDIAITPLLADDDTIVVLVATLTRNYGSSYILDLMNSAGTEDLMLETGVLDLQTGYDSASAIDMQNLSGVEDLMLETGNTDLQAGIVQAGDNSAYVIDIMNTSGTQDLASEVGTVDLQTGIGTL